MKENITNFKENGYCVVKSAISSELRDVVTQYALFDEMQDFAANDTQVPASHSKYADPAMESMLVHLQSAMEQNTGLNLHPTYSYYRVYRDGALLSKHTDRFSCEISATVCFNFSYDPDRYNWPIYMNNSKIIMEPGDMVIYRGCDLEHYRDKFVSPSGDEWHVQGFFHYVDANGPNSNWKYDKRNSLGEIGPEEIAKKKNTSSHKSYIQYL